MNMRTATIPLLLVSFIAGCGDNTTTPTQPVAAKSDAELVKSLRDAMTEMEDAVKADEDQIHDIAAAMRKDKAQSDKAMHLAMMEQMLQRLYSRLDASTSMKVPPISNPDAARYALAMVDDHKQGY